MAGEDTSKVWIPSIVDRIARFLSTNEVACSLRVVDKATAAMLRSPEFTTVRLSEPVPHHAFAWRWGRPGSMHDLTLARRRELLCLTAASGAADNLALAARACGCPLTNQVAYSAGRAGQLGSCLALEELGCDLRRAVEGAAAGGHQALCVEQANMCSHFSPIDCANAAAKGGHADLFQWMLGWDIEPALHAGGWRFDAQEASRCAAWRGHLHVVAWLAETPDLGVALDELLFEGAGQSGSVELMAWLRERGCPWDVHTFTAAAKSGCEAALEWLAERGCPMPEDGSPFTEAARSADLLTLECLRRLGCPSGPSGSVVNTFIRSGAHRTEPDARKLPNGGLLVLEWLVDAGCPVDWPAAVEEAEAQARTVVRASAGCDYSESCRRWREESEALVAWMRSLAQ
ncbi:hypothetical protein GPECTOR_56g348 [Gonium pectorale]|uniref:PI-PLC Y-box domain-containing protein n=1 Tax=Gonium pectorale TaxID=33097 RepID=A0A150G5X3_GONPE|nr:hypothetical protein GPECTOR_56g348 [Gonium pectorale]|eukprot:KXZ45252.1 hypothetical protein GPECTOR_56g348 [Gonium pectorale]